MTKSVLTMFFLVLSNLFLNVYSSNGRMVVNNTNIILKTIHGDEYNCVDIYEQPAFRHPALKNHKIPVEFIRDMEQTLAEKVKDENWIFHPKNIWSNGEGCPKGTVPIRKRLPNPTTQSAPSLPSTMEFIRQVTKQEKEKVTGRLMCKGAAVSPESAPAHYDFAGIIAKERPGNNYHGGSARINIYNPSLKGNDETSAAVISVEDPSSAAIVQAGWTVNPSVYDGDTRTKLFCGWALKGVSCYNDRCPGYVIMNRNIPADYVFPDISHVEKIQFDTLFGLFLHGSGNWYFCFEEYNNIMGYWPKEIFMGLLNDGGGSIIYGGLVTSSNNVSPQMGSGTFIDKEYNITCYMRQVKVMDPSTRIINPDDSFIAGKDSRCYYEKDHSLDNDPYWGYKFLFGGAGGKDCYDCLY